MRKNLRKLICTTTVAVVLLGVSNTALASSYINSSRCNVSNLTVKQNCNNSKPNTTKPNCNNSKPNTGKPDCNNSKPNTTKPDCGNSKPSTTTPSVPDNTENTTKPTVPDNTENTTKPSVDNNETPSGNEESKTDIVTPVVNENSTEIEEGTLGVSDIEEDNEDTEDAKTIAGVKTGDNSKLPLQIFLGSIASGALFVVNRFLRK